MPRASIRPLLLIAVVALLQLSPLPASYAQETPPAPPAVITPAGQVPGSFNAVAIRGALAYVGGEAGLSIYDVSRPAAARLVGSLQTPQPVQAVQVVGDLAYLAEGDPDDYGYPNRGTVQIVDVRQPAAPVARGAIVIAPQGGAAIEVRGGLAFVGGSYAGPFNSFSSIQTLDVTDPANPTLLGRYDTPGMPLLDLRVEGTTVYAANSVAGRLNIYDAGDPAALAPIGTFDTEALGVRVVGRFAFIASPGIFSGPRAVQVLDVGDPSAPALVAEHPLPCQPSAIETSGERAYVVCQPSGGSTSLVLLDISSPTRIRTLAEYQLGGTYSSFPAQQIKVSGDLIFVADGSAGLQILRVIAPGQPAARPARPAEVRLAAQAAPALAVGRGEVLTVTLTATNRGEGSAEQAVIEVPLDPARVEVLDARASRRGAWVSDLRDDGLTIQTGRLGSGGDAVSVTLRLRVLAGAPDGPALPGRPTLRWADATGGGSGAGNQLAVRVADASRESPTLPLTVEPAEAAAGVARDVRASALAPDEPVALWYNTPDGEAVALGRAKAAADGGLAYRLDTGGLPAGRYSLVAQGVWSGLTLAGEFVVR